MQGHQCKDINAHHLKGQKWEGTAETVFGEDNERAPGLGRSEILM